MIDLQLLSGLPIKFDELAEKFAYGEGVTYKAINRIPISSMLPSLLNKAVRYPELVYMEHKNIHHQDHQEIFSRDDLHYDLVMIPSGLMGVEFIRTHIFYAESMESKGLSEIVEVQSGSLTILLQRNKPKQGEYDFDTRVSEGLVVKLSRGEKFYLPRGYYYTFINTRTKPVVFSRFYLRGCICDYTRFQREQGLAYFAIRKNAKQEIVLNPRYREIPQIRKANAGQLSDWVSSLFNAQKEVNLSAEPLYQQIIARAEELEQLL